ncbi:MAG: hypothetical protein WDO06_10005 [Actinomycetota bacterium]
MSFVLQSRHVAPTYTKVVRYPLDATQVSSRAAASRSTPVSHSKKAH